MTPKLVEPPALVNPYNFPFEASNSVPFGFVPFTVLKSTFFVNTLVVMSNSKSIPSLFAPPVEVIP